MESAKGKCSKFLKLEFGHSAADLVFSYVTLESSDCYEE